MKNNQDVFWLVNNNQAVTLSRKGLIPSYFAELWAKSHGGIKPLWWRVIHETIEMLWKLLGLAIILLSGTIVPENKWSFAIFMVYILIVMVTFMIGHEHFDFFKKTRMNWIGFNSNFKEISYLFYCDNAIPKTPDKFVQMVHDSLVNRALHQLKEKPKADWQSSYPMKGLYDAAKEFGILVHGDTGYGPYFKEAQELLDREEMPLFHRQ